MVASIVSQKWVIVPPFNSSFPCRIDVLYLTIGQMSNKSFSCEWNSSKRIGAATQQCIFKKNQNLVGQIVGKQDNIRVKVALCLGKYINPETKKHHRKAYTTTMTRTRSNNFPLRWTPTKRGPSPCYSVGSAYRMVERLERCSRAGVLLLIHWWCKKEGRRKRVLCTLTITS